MKSDKMKAMVLTAIMTIAVLAVMPAMAHFPGAVINSNWKTITPTIDGVLFAGEWDDATVIDIKAADPANPFAAYGYFKNDGDFIYILLDASGDITLDNNDRSVLSFDTGHDAIPTDGAEDNFIISGAGMTWHYVWDATAGAYVIHCSPFDPSLPDHAGLAGVHDFGVSPNSAISHSIYEYQIPLALIEAVPGDTLGFALDGEIASGIWDHSIQDGDQWPVRTRPDPIPLGQYGDLVLASKAAVPALTPIGIAALVGLLAIVATSTIVRKREKR